LQSDVLSERQKRQIVEDSDLENAKGMFAGLDAEYKIDIANPKDEKDFEVLATTLADKLANYEVFTFNSIQLIVCRKTSFF
jgi:hypothetical protein